MPICYVYMAGYLRRLPLRMKSCGKIGVGGWEKAATNHMVALGQALVRPGLVF
jgi:hypothetical protein